MTEIIIQPASPTVDTPMPGSPRQLINFVASYLRMTGLDNLQGVIISTTEPSPEDRDKVWAKLDQATNRPIGLYVYQGGWILVPVIPASGDVRPGNPKLGEQFWDTTIGCQLVYNGVKWVTATGQTGDVKFVNATTIIEALRLNPGWAQFDAATGRVIAAAGTTAGMTPRAVGETWGAEEITQTVDQLPAHSHKVKAMNSTGRDGDNGSPVVGHIAPTTVDSEPVGGGEPMEISQPTIALWCLIKQ